MSFENVKVIVTGGARGIGKACVKAFANKGATVIIWILIKQVKNY